MWVRFIIVSFLITLADYMLLVYLDAYLLKYFVVTHAIFMFINLSILILFAYLKKNQAEFVGLGVMAGLVFKMLLAMGIFVVLYNKLHLDDIQTINYLFVYFCYTILFVITVLKSKDLKIS